MQSAVLLLFCSVMSVGLGSNGFYFWDRTEVGINLDEDTQFDDEDLLSGSGSSDYSGSGSGTHEVSVTTTSSSPQTRGSSTAEPSQMRISQSTGSTTTESRETTTAPAKTKSTGSTTTESRQTTTARPKAEQHHQSRATSPDSTKADQRVSTSRSTGTVGDKTDITDETRPYLIGGLIGSGLVLLLVAIALGVVIKRRASRRNEHLLDDDVSDANHQIQHIQRLIS
ncbi:GPI-anchored hemophore cfmA-like isoform X2 [Haliotis rufescens]|uniref:GPI-anchored hemophore cfmA-like isoform X2 n=1 Tax=Haliotis rufescens TaxID=6454 RepID=UPI001EB05973|nr:GPI-anchored hemophore cfmA-like isoform X2 [Haliotis rufescens]